METRVITIQVADDGTLIIPDDLVRTLRLAPRQTITVTVREDALVLTPSRAECLDRIGHLLRVALQHAEPSNIEAGRQDRCF
jgi:antitoxin component of MazEF toxin-antitoxin module